MGKGMLGIGKEGSDYDYILRKLGKFVLSLLSLLMFSSSLKSYK